jgi:hypothetical protein
VIRERARQFSRAAFDAKFRAALGGLKPRPTS